jgi:hypothetical protein
LCKQASITYAGSLDSAVAALPSGFGSLQSQRLFTIALASNQQRGFVFMAIAILFISGAMGTWFTYGKQYVAQASFAQTQATATEIAVIDQAALSSFSLYPDDRFLSVRAQLALSEMN